MSVRHGRLHNAVLTVELRYHCCLCTCSCPYLTMAYSILIGVYQGILTMYVVINFGMATFMDPGVYPKGNCISFFYHTVPCKHGIIMLWPFCLSACLSHALSVSECINISSNFFTSVSPVFLVFSQQTS